MIQLGRFDELGSGVTNINKYLPLYAKGAKPVFKETRHGFELILPLNGRASGEINEGVSEGVSELLKFIIQNPGKRIPELSSLLNIPKKTIERWIKKLKKDNKIEFIGSFKKGGYYLKN